MSLRRGASAWWLSSWRHCKQGHRPPHGAGAAAVEGVLPQMAVPQQRVAGRPRPRARRHITAHLAARFLISSSMDVRHMHLPASIGANIRAYRQLAPHRMTAPDGLPSLTTCMSPSLFHNRRILDPTTHLPFAWPIWARRALLRVGDLCARVSAQLEDVPVELRAGLPPYWPHYRPASGPQGGWSQWDSSDQRVWRWEVGGQLQVAHVASASGALLPAPPATSVYGPHACLQPALVMPWYPARLWHPSQGRAASGQQGATGAEAGKGLHTLTPALPLPLHRPLALAVPQSLALTRVQILPWP